MAKHRRLVRAAAVAVAVAFSFAVPLFAHMKFAKSAPAPNATIAAPPSSIQVWFTQDPDPKLIKLAMTGPSGAVALTNVHTMGDKSVMATVGDATPDGAYTVAWQAAGNDGHVQKGEFKFTLKRAAQGATGIR